MAVDARAELNISIDDICNRATATLRDVLRNKTVSCRALDQCIGLADVVIAAPTYADAQRAWLAGDLTRETLWAALCRQPPWVSCAVVHNGGGRFCMAELLGMAALRLTFLQARAQQRSPHPPPALELNAAPGVAVADYTMEQYMAALQLLRAALPRALYSEALLAHCYELELRGATLLANEWPESVLNLPRLRTLVHGAAYTANTIFATTVWCVFRGVNRWLLVLPVPLPVTVLGRELCPLRMLGAFKEFFLRAAKATRSTSSSYVLAACYATLCLRPGDVEICRHARLVAVDEALQICAALHSAAAMESLSKALRSSAAELLVERLPAVTPGCAEPTEVALCLAEMLDNATRAMGLPDRRCFVPRYCAIHPAAQLYHDELARLAALGPPLLVQLSNHWQVWTAEGVQQTNSFLWALHYFVVALPRDHELMRAEGPFAELRALCEAA